MTYSISHTQSTSRSSKGSRDNGEHSSEQVHPLRQRPAKLTALPPQTYIPPGEQDPIDLAWMREALIMVSASQGEARSAGESSRVSRD